MNKHNPICTPRVARGRFAALAAAPLASAVLSLLASTGCQQQADQPGYIGKEAVGAAIFTRDDDDARSINRIATAQTANAARTDATLRPYHFQGPELNSLGQQKLDLMTKAERGDSPLKVYLDLPQDPDQGTRRDAVLVYLKDRGLKDEQIAIEAGPNLNPENLHPTAQSMKMLHLLDAGAPVGNNPEPGGTTPAPAPAAAAAAGHY
jgi:hypothetical protein